MSRALAIIACLLAFATQLAARAASPAALNLRGEEVRPLAETNSPAIATVLLFLGVECPISNSYAPTYRRLFEEFKGKNVRFFAVYPNKDETVATIEAHLKEYKLPLEALRDPRHELVKAAKATRTPEAAVFMADGKLVYRGRIDNRHANFGEKRPFATEHDVRDLLAEIVAGKAPKPRSTTPVGCSIPSLE